MKPTVSPTAMAGTGQPPVAVTIRCRLRPTEDPKRVATAIASIFPDARLTTSAEAVEGRTGQLGHLKQCLARERIRDTALTVFRKALDADPAVLRFPLHRQAAVVGRTSFSIGHPLGEMEVEITATDPKGIVQWLTDGGTREGRWGDDDEEIRDS